MGAPIRSSSRIPVKETNFGGKPFGAGDERGEFFGNISVLDFHRTDFDNPVHFSHGRLIIESRRLQVEYHESVLFQVIGLIQLVKETRLRIIDIGFGKDRAVNGGNGLSLAGFRERTRGGVPKLIRFAV